MVRRKYLLKPTAKRILAVNMLNGLQLVRSCKILCCCCLTTCYLATATYRLLPTIDLKEDICGDSAYAFAKCFPPGVVVVEKSQGRFGVNYDRI